MNEDVKCPYCNKWQEINHDDGYGYEEDEYFEQECGYCDKVFCYSTTISFYHSAWKAPCLNGKEHDFRHPESYPDIYPDHKICKVCGYEIRGDRDEEKVEEYLEQLGKKRER